MPKPRPTNHALLRLALMALSALLAWLVGADTFALRVVIGVHAAAAILGSLCPPSHLSPRARYSLAAFDLAAFGCTAWLATIPMGTPLAQHAPFLGAFAVAVLVATIAPRRGGGALGLLCAALILALSTAWLAEASVHVPRLAAQVLWLACASFEVAAILGHIQDESLWGEMSVSVERELKAREAESQELAALAHGLADAPSPTELIETLLRYLRCHLDLRARAAVLSSEGSTVAYWEEQGQLGDDQIERRRVLLGRALARAGGNNAVEVLHVRAFSADKLPGRIDFHTQIEVPIRTTGRVAGMILLGDPRRGALSTQRVGIVADVARRVGEALGRLERRRGEEHRRTASLLEQMRDGILMLSRDGTVMIANPAAREALDQCTSPDGVPCLGGVPLTELALTPPGIGRRFRAHQIDAPTGRGRHFACSAVGVMEDGKRLGALITLSDVTEEELARSRLVQAERSTLVGQTLAGVAHELNNPLAALIGYADLLGSVEVPEHLERPVRSMRDQALRATRIVKNLLDFARKRNPHRTQTDLTATIESTIELYAYEARMSGVEIDLDIAEGLPPVLADGHAIQQVLVNLIQNGIHALRDHEGPRDLQIHAWPEEGRVVIRVRDSGPGIPDELRARVFQPFFTTKGNDKGTGLGLALSANIARDHGGDLLLEADQGTGASFLLRLPIREATAPAPSQKALDRIPVLPESVLVVDDEPEVRSALAAQLGSLGTTVESAGTVEEALRLIRTRRYDAVLTDLRMPGASGLDLHASLLQRGAGAAQRLIFMTGDFVNDELQEAVATCGAPYLEKPFTLEELATALDEVMQRTVRPGHTSITATN